MYRLVSFLLNVYLFFKFMFENIFNNNAHNIFLDFIKLD